MVHRFVANRPGAAPAIWIPGAFGTNQHRDTWEGGDQKNQPLGVDFRLATCDDLQRATRGDFQLALDSWLVEDVASRLDRRREPADRTRAIPLAELERLWRREDASVRDRAFWRVCYETASE